MSWYKDCQDGLLRADTSVIGPGVTITPDTPTDQPIDGWAWYATDDDALAELGLATVIDLEATQAVILDILATMTGATS